jgi:hypothetical protein
MVRYFAIRKFLVCRSSEKERKREREERELPIAQRYDVD